MRKQTILDNCILDRLFTGIGDHIWWQVLPGIQISWINNCPMAIKCRNWVINDACEYLFKAASVCKA